MIKFVKRRKYNKIVSFGISVPLSMYSKISEKTQKQANNKGIDTKQLGKTCMTSESKSKRTHQYCWNFT